MKIFYQVFTGYPQFNHINRNLPPDIEGGESKEKNKDNMINEIQPRG